MSYYFKGKKASHFLILSHTYVSKIFRVKKKRLETQHEIGLAVTTH